MTGGLLGRIVAALVVAAALLLGTWFVCSATTGASLITFRTGSMAPSMPQGALAVALPVDAADIAVGDVVTVQRGAGELPVTHRVVEVRTPGEASSASPLAPSERELVLKGDDNDHADLEPYIVSEARRVLFAAPGLGSALMLLQSPLGMGLLTLLAGGLTVWAFWPAGRDRGERESAGRHARSGRLAGEGTRS